MAAGHHPRTRIAPRAPEVAGAPRSYCENELSGSGGGAFNETVSASANLVSRYRRGFWIGFETLSGHKKMKDRWDGGVVRFSAGLGYTIFD